jgi:hypothetical protein
LVQLAVCSKEGCKGHLVGFKLDKGQEGEQMANILVHGAPKKEAIGFVMANRDHAPVFPMKEVKDA